LAVCGAWAGAAGGVADSVLGCWLLAAVAVMLGSGAG
jgi:hypothetical protein